ncbi:hypothetical protein RG47T_1337 [Mucilaginibacter polytrichastri]|uniref:HTH araC/xylS-type domain-containing protein n=2 Tax=Mucilaginibacter polytrichastri TaxID=1302689 RepID=A0A1Q5ZVV0_9SPHI|nr:hypothetical protein RG47T_1337 [Mucilaginibacter polytrichastri]
MLGKLPDDCRYKISFALEAELTLLKAGRVIRQSCKEFLAYMEIYEFVLKTELEFSFEVEETAAFLFFLIGKGIRFYLPDSTPVIVVEESTGYATFNTPGKYIGKLPKGTTHAVYIHPRTAWLWRQIEQYAGLEDFLEWMESGTEQFGHMPRVKVRETMLCTLLEELALLDARKVGDMEIAKMTITKELLKQYYEMVQKKLTSTVYRIWYFIKKNYTNHRLTNIRKLINRYAVSLKTLEREYFHEFEITPANDVKRLRMRKSHSLLLETVMSIREVALFVGYSNTSSFGKAFKKHFGYTPTELRDKKRGT